MDHIHIEMVRKYKQFYAKKYNTTDGMYTFPNDTNYQKLLKNKNSLIPIK